MPNNVSNVSFFGPQALGAALAPDAYQQSLQAQQQQALAQGLMGQGMTPLDPNRSSGRFATRINPLEGVAKMAQTYMGTKLQQQSNLHQALAARQMQAALLAAAQGGTPGAQPQATASAGGSVPGMSPNTSQMAFGTPDYASQAQPSPQGMPQSQGGPNYLQLAAIGDLYGPEAAKVAAAGMTPTDLEKTMAAAGIDSRSPQGRAFLEANLKKQNFIPPTVVRQNSVALDPNGQMMFANPAAAEGTTNVWQPGNPYPTSNQRVPGSLENIGEQARVKEFGTKAGAFPFSTLHTTQGEMPAFMVPGAMNRAPQLQTGQQPQQPQFGQQPQQPTAPFSSAPSAPAPKSQSNPDDPWSSMPVYKEETKVGMSPYSEALQRERAGSIAKLSEKYGKLADENNQKMANNNAALALVDRADTGPMAVQIADVKNWLTSRMGIPETDFANTPSATQALNKDLLNSAIQKAKQYYQGRISTAEVKLQIERGSPNVDMTKAAIKYLINLDNATSQYGIKQGNDFGPFIAKGGDPLQYEQWYAKAFPMSKALEGIHLDVEGKETPQSPTPQGAPFNPQQIVDELRRRGAVQ